MKRADAEMLERNNRWALDYQNGLTLREIAEKHGVTRERVRQVIRKIGVTKHEGGHAMGGGLMAARSRAADDRKEIRAQRLAQKRQKRMDEAGMATGVSFHKTSGLYRAQVHSMFLPGYHNTPEAAAQARAEALARGRQ